MRTHGWQEPFRQRPWVEIQAFLEGMAVRDARFQHMSNIVESVLTSDQAEALAACTSMHDLIVVPAPVSKPPYGVVVVRAPGSLHEPATGLARIEHLSVTGHDDRIDRPVVDAVPLFWRFMIEKFGRDPGARVGAH